MAKLTRALLLTSIACNTHSAIAMDMPEEKIHLVVVPGQNGLGGQNVDTALPQFNKQQTHHAETPERIIDFGQNRCMGYLKETMSLLKENDKAIIHASSQGTATALNFAAESPEKIKALILEGIMLSGNSAILYNTDRSGHMPGSYYWLPYAAKIMFPFYAPAGTQPILNVDKIPTHLPIIIMHHTNDFQLSFQDAQALYAQLRQNGNKNVYLMPITKHGIGHVLLLDENYHETAVLNAILKKHALPWSDHIKDRKIDTVNPDEYQPEPQQEWISHFTNLLRKENVIQKLDWGVKASFYGILAFLLCSKYF